MSSPPLDVVTGAFSYTGRAIAERLAQRRPARAHAVARSGVPTGSRDRVGAAPVRRPGRARREPRGRGHALQHVLDPLPARRVDLRARRREHARAARSRPRGGRAPGRARQRLEPERRLAARVLPRQGRDGARRPRVGALPRDRAADARLRRRRRARQQHRLDPAPAPAVRAPRRRPRPASSRSRSRTWPGSASRPGLRDGDETLDAAGPETLPFAELVAVVRDAIGSRGRASCGCRRGSRSACRARSASSSATSSSPARSWRACRPICSSPPSRRAVSGRSRRWLVDNGAVLGRTYVSELARNYRHAPL